MNRSFKTPLLILTIVSCMGTITASLAAQNRYGDNGDGTVTDRQARLILLKNADCFGKKGWQAALEAVQNLATGSCGLTDGSQAGAWQLPPKTLLPNLFDWKNSRVFFNVKTHFYWSNTPYENIKRPDQPWAWVIYLGGGQVGWDNAANGNYVWPVRRMP